MRVKSLLLRLVVVLPLLIITLISAYAIITRYINKMRIMDYQAWTITDGIWLKEISLTQKASYTMLQPVTQYDLDLDNMLETVHVKNGRGIISEGGKFEWNSPEDWQIKQAEITDLNHDNNPEVLLLLWRPFKPWPIDSFLVNPGRIQSYQDKDGLSCHVILIGWKKGNYREIWAGSPLARPLRSIFVIDLNEDGKQELIGLESRYNEAASSPADSLTVWEWNGFGFSLLARQKGSFSELLIVQISDRINVLTR